MRRLPDWLIYGVLLALIVLYARSESADIEPPPPPPDLGPLLPSANPRDPSIIVDVAEIGPGVGTAFSNSDDGHWLTARHVVDGCDDIGVRIDRRRIVRVETVEIDQSSDLAILRTRWNREPLPTDLTQRRRIGELGYFIGYPQGRPGEVVGSLQSRQVMRVRGRYQSDEPVLSWAELGRTRGLSGSLGGLSGSPVLDADGEVVGVVTAEAPRRGRVYTVAPVSLRRVAQQVKGETTTLDYEGYTLQADRLRRDRRIAQVICFVG